MTRGFLVSTFSLASLVAACGLPSAGRDGADVLDVAACNTLLVNNQGEGWDVLNLRSRPNGRILGAVKVGYTVNFIRDNGDGWYQVSTTDGIVGFMYARYLLSFCPVTPTPTARPTAAPTPRPTAMPTAAPVPTAAPIGEPVDEDESDEEAIEGGGEIFEAVPVATCPGAEGKPAFELKMAKDGTGKRMLLGMNPEGETLMAEIAATRAVLNRWRDVEVDVQGQIGMANGQPSSVSRILLENALGNQSGRLSLTVAGTVRSFDGCRFENTAQVHSRAGDFLISRCRDAAGAVSSDLVVRLDADGRLEKVSGFAGAGTPQFSGRLVSRKSGVQSQKKFYDIGFENENLVQPSRTVRLQFLPGARTGDVRFKSSTSEERYFQCQFSNLFLLDEAL